MASFPEPDQRNDCDKKWPVSSARKTVGTNIVIKQAMEIYRVGKVHLNVPQFFRTAKVQLLNTPDTLTVATLPPY